MTDAQAITDGNIPVDLHADAITVGFSPSIITNDITQYTNICFIDATVTSFSEYLNTETYPVIYSSNTDRDSLKTFLLTQFTHIDRVAFVFHGPPDNSPPLTSAWFINNEPYFSLDNQGFLQEIFSALTVKNVDFLPCNLLQQQEWKDYFAMFTNVAVGASIDDTGNLLYGGDWVMENTMQNVQTIYFSTEIENYTGLLFTQVGPVGKNVAQLQALGYTPAVLNANGYVTPDMTLVKSYSTTAMPPDYILPPGYGFHATFQICISGNTLYSGVSYMVNSFNLSEVNPTVATHSTNVMSRSIIVIGNYLYYCMATGIGRLNLDGTTNGNATNFITGLEFSGMLPAQYATDETYIYAIGRNSTTCGVHRIPISSTVGSTAGPFFITSGPVATSWLVGAPLIFGSYIYVYNSINGNIEKYDLATGNTVNKNFATNIGTKGFVRLNTTCMAVYKSSIYIGTAIFHDTTTTYHGIQKISLLDGTMENPTYFINKDSITLSTYGQTGTSNSTNIFSMVVHNDKLYCSTYTHGTIITIPFIAPYVAANPTATYSITYPATLGTLTISGGTVEIPGSPSPTPIPGIFTVTTALNNTIYNVGTYTDISAIFTPTDTINYYNTIATKIPSVTVLKGTPFPVTRPTAVGSYPNKLSTVGITGGVYTAGIGGNTVVPGTFTIHPDLSNSIFAVGIYQDVSAVFTPSSTTNYNSMETTIQTVTITKGSTLIATVGTPGDILKGAYCCTIGGDYMYVGGRAIIYKIDLRTNTIVNANFFNVTATDSLRNISAMIYHQGFLYVRAANYTMAKIDASTGSLVSMSWISTLSGESGINTDGTYLYLSSSTAIYRAPISTGGVASVFISSLSDAKKVLILGSYLYVPNRGGNNIAKYNLSDGLPVTANFTSSPIPYIQSIVSYNSLIYVGQFTADNVPHGILQIGLDGTILNTYFFANSQAVTTSFYTNIRDMAIYNNKIYCATNEYATIISIQLNPEPYISARASVSTSITYPAAIGSVILTSGSALDISGGNTVVSGTFGINFDISNTIYNAGTYADVPATFYPTDAVTYSSVSTSIPSITVLKATPYLVARPTTAFATSSKTLSSLVAIGGVCTAGIGGNAVPGSFIIHPDLSNSFFTEGTYQDVSAVFLSTNYNIETTIQTVTITRGSTVIATGLGRMGVQYPGMGSYGCALDGHFLYVGAYSALKKIDLRTNSIVDFYLGTTYIVTSMVFHQGFIYFRSGNYTVTKINATTGSVVSNSWINNVAGELGINTDGTYLYLSTSTAIYRAPISTGGSSTLFISGLSDARKVLILGSYLYVPNRGGNNIAKYNLSDGAIVTANFTSSPIPYIQSIVSYNSMIYVGQSTPDNVAHGILQIGLDGTILKTYFFVNPQVLPASFYTNIQDMLIYNNKLHCTTADSASIISIQLNTAPYISTRASVSTSITYPATIGSVILTSGSALDISGGNTAVPGTFGIRLDISNTIYNAGIYTDVPATFYPTDAVTYSSFSTSIPSITVLKATPYLVARPTSATTIFPNKLSAIVITGGSCTVTNGGVVLPGTFTISPDLSNSIYVAGTYQNVTAIFTPTSANYNTVATTIQTLTITQVATSQLRTIGLSSKDLKSAGYSAADLQKAGFSATELKAGPFTPQELMAVGFSATTLYAAFTTSSEKKSVTRAVVSDLLSSTAKSAVPLTTLVGYSFASTVTSAVAVKVTDANTPAIVNKSEIAKGVAVVYAVLDGVSSYVVLPTWSSTIRVTSLGNETYRIYDSNGTTVLSDNLVAGDTRTYDGLTVVIGSVTATLAIQPNINFVLSGLNSVIHLSESGEIPNYHPILTTDATITLSTGVPATVLQNTFFYRTDNPITLDASFVYHYVDTTKWANQSTTLSPRNGTVTSEGYVSNDTGGKDFLRDLARQLFGTYLGTDLFTNEDAVVEDINTKFDSVATRIISLLTSIDISSGSPIVMSTDEFGKKYLKDDTATTNISRELLNELMTSAPTRFADIKTNYLYNATEDGYYKIPILPLDTISFMVTLYPAADQTTMVPTGRTSLTPRSYTVILNVT